MQNLPPAVGQHRVCVSWPAVLPDLRLGSHAEGGSMLLAPASPGCHPPSTSLLSAAPVERHLHTLVPAHPLAGPACERGHQVVDDAACPSDRHACSRMLCKERWSCLRPQPSQWWRSPTNNYPKMQKCPTR